MEKKLNNDTGKNWRYTHIKQKMANQLGMKRKEKILKQMDLEQNKHTINHLQKKVNVEKNFFKNIPD